MLCPTCQNEARRFGRTRNGSQRYQCLTCRRTFTDAATRVDGRRLPGDKTVLVLRMLLEGNSVRSIERLLGVHRDTILTAMVDAGQKCQRFLDAVLLDIPANDVQADEIWGFVWCKQKLADLQNYPAECGDAYCFTAFERHTKMIIAWQLGKRDPATTRLFATKLNRATAGRFQLTTDGFRPYLNTIPAVFGNKVDFATLVKVYGESEDERRYSAPPVTEVIVTSRHGNPDMDAVCTSHVERSNLTIRMTIRRLTRLTNAHSKKWENHEAALALFFAYYNFCRVHSTIKQTPAMKAGLTDHVWSLQELLDTARSAA